MKTYYLSGKISGTEDHARRHFAEAKKHLESLGYAAVNPFDNGLTSDDTWEKHLAVDILDMQTCDGIVQLRGWEDSRGARLEHEIAVLLKLEIRNIADLGFYESRPHFE